MATATVTLSKNTYDQYSYLMRYDDVRAKWGYPAKQHWDTLGKKEGRTPGPDLADGDYVVTSNPVFDAKCYVSRYDDVRLNGMDPFDHWTKYGQAEGRIPGCNIYTPVAQASASTGSSAGTTLDNLVNPVPGSTTTTPATGSGLTGGTTGTAPATPAAGTTGSSISSTVSNVTNTVKTAAKKVPTWAWWAGGILIAVIIGASLLKGKPKAAV